MLSLLVREGPSKVDLPRIPGGRVGLGCCCPLSRIGYVQERGPKVSGMDNGMSVAGSVRVTDNGRLSSLTVGGKNVSMIAITGAALFLPAVAEIGILRLPTADELGTKGFSKQRHHRDTK